MLNLQKKLKEQREKQNGPRSGAGAREACSIRDRLLMTEVQQLPSALPPGCRIEFPTSEFHTFLVIVTPTEGLYAGGCFRFEVIVPPEYNFEPPSVKCLTKVLHPNISEAGSVCLSVLRSLSVDGMGWNPARGIKDVVLGIYALFGDLIDFNDPLNHDAASLYQRDPSEFRMKVREYIRKHCNRPI
uniref:E2 NEDD8-conjugating enzyme n=1 Tax=Trichuris muris TaxID=70415 RepID=A0A5S6QRR5_TRIMR